MNGKLKAAGAITVLAAGTIGVTSFMQVAKDADTHNMGTSKSGVSFSVITGGPSFFEPHSVKPMAKVQGGKVTRVDLFDARSAEELPLDVTGAASMDLFSGSGRAVVVVACFKPDQGNEEIVISPLGKQLTYRNGGILTDPYVGTLNPKIVSMASRSPSSCTALSQ